MFCRYTGQTLRAMTSERSQAYGRVMRRLEDATGVKLHDAEIAIIRDAADTLLFAGSARRTGAAEAILLVERLMQRPRRVRPLDGRVRAGARRRRRGLRPGARHRLS